MQLKEFREECFHFEIKEVNEQGRFIGRSAVYGNRDRGDDIIVQGALAKTVAEKNGKFPLFYGHKVNVGVSHAEDKPDGLWTEGFLNLEKEIARDVYSDLKFYKTNGVDFGMSIGYGSIPSKTEFKNGVRYLKEIILYENTLTELPMNPLALTTAVKSYGYEEMLKEIAEIKAGRRFSAETQSKIEKFISDLRALMTEESSTPEDGAAKSEAVEPPPPSTEPEPLHSWLSDAMSDFQNQLSAILQ